MTDTMNETVETGTSASGPPNQSANRSGSVHSLHTRSRGASKTRVNALDGRPPQDDGERQVDEANQGREE